VAAGAQVAILAPTSVLAEQYIDAAAPLARATGASIALVAAGLPAAQRKRVAEALARGDIAIAVGTHALLSRGTAFARLGLVIVDEQHRLGVAQRLALVQKGATPHLLTLSATPIPRTLALALRGELATSTLDERPRGRAPVATELLPRARFADAIAAMRAACERGERVFFVAPRIDDDDDGAKRRATELAKTLAPAKVALVHGALSADAKREAMRALRTGTAQVLVATTVIEVGVDVPEATLMVVDGADRFGLAQLHQLRGRVGRGAVPGRCILVHDELGDLARRRLEAIARTHDGATIARIDLELRGAGDLGGTRQSGAEEELRFLDPNEPPPWLERIEADVRAITARDPELALPEHRALRLAVARYERALAVREEAG
jgi:ATP-dependent DNA helicase RecG